MIFGSVALADALGAVLAHTHRLPGRTIKKGAVLDAAALEAFAAAGQTVVIAARLEPGDVAEDASARRVAAALLTPGLRAGPAATGRVNLHAEYAGLLRVDAARIDALNGVDEAVTVATLPDFAPVAAGEMVATIKVIPFAVAGPVLDRIAAAAVTPPLTLHAFRPRAVGLVLSTLPGMKASVIEGTVVAMQARVESVGGNLLPPLTCAHDSEAIAGALRSLQRQGAELLLVAGASATVDRRDVGPAAIELAGGELRHFGMPVDPGNLICLGVIGAAPALVLPGCARSPKLNGIDWVLRRLFAGFAVGAAEVMRMGVGGLLKDTGLRPLPRHLQPHPQQPAAQVAAVVLAAGRSSRMAPQHKLLAEGRDGRPMVARTVAQVLESGARPVLVVVGHQAEAVRAALAGLAVRFVEAADFAQGQSASLRAGIAALPVEVAAAVVCLGDMPLVGGGVIDRLIAVWRANPGRPAVQPTYQGEPGNPVLWDRGQFARLAAITGDIGARDVLRRLADAVERVEVESDAVLRDFDTPESLALLDVED